MSHWAEDLDFAGPKARTAWWAWVVLGLGVLSMLMLADQLDQLSQASDDALAQSQRLSRAERRLRLAQATLERQAAQTQGEAQGAAPELKGPALADVAKMSLLLGYPWDTIVPLLEAQASAHHVAMTGLSVDLSSLTDPTHRGPVWRLQAAVGDDTNALAWASSLPQGKLLSRERLAQPVQGTHDRFAFKVSAVMSWPDTVVARAKP